MQKTIQVYTAQMEDLWIYEEQLALWKKENLSPRQAKEIKRLGEQVEQLRTVLTDILTLADKLKEGTIEKILAKSDAELALEVLAGKWKTQ